MTQHKAPSVFGGAMIIAGTAIGAGMLANPTATAGVWFGWSLLVFFYVWLCMLSSGLMVLEATTHYPSNANMATMTNDLLGKGFSVFNSLSLLFTLYILLYAYITSGGDLTAKYLGLMTDGEIVPKVGSLILTGLFMLFVWLSTKAVDRVATILMIGMIVSFFVSIAGLLGTMDTAILFDVAAPVDTAYTPYLWAALSTILVSFGYQVSVPSMTKYFAGDSKKVSQAVMIGTVLALVFYLLWQVAVQGNLPRRDFASVIAADGQVTVLLDAIGKQGLINTMLNAFAYMALTSSFLGVALGLFDFLADMFGFDDSKQARTKVVALVFLPPLVFSLLAPFGFVKAIGFAGLALTIWGVITPALLVLASRKRYKTASYRAFGGQFMVYFVIVFGVLNILVQLASYVNLIPVFKG